MGLNVSEAKDREITRLFHLCAGGRETNLTELLNGFPETVENVQKILKFAKENYVCGESLQTVCLGYLTANNAAPPEEVKAAGCVLDEFEEKQS